VGADIARPRDTAGQVGVPAVHRAAARVAVRRSRPRPARGATQRPDGFAAAARDDPPTETGGRGAPRPLGTARPPASATGTACAARARTPAPTARDAAPA